MSGNNGKHPPIMMAGSPIPIVGQAATLKEFCPTVLIQCNCEAKAPVLIVGAKAVKACQACKRRYTITAIHWDARAGTLALEIGLVPEDIEHAPPRSAIIGHG